MVGISSGTFLKTRPSRIAFVDGTLKMTHLGGWIKRRGEVDAPGEGLTPNRLADMLDVMRSAPPKEPTMAFAESPPQTAKAEPSRPPVAPATQRRLVVPAVVAPTLNVPDLAPPPVWDVGRHRPPTSQKLAIRGASFISRRLALMGVLTLLVVASMVLFSLK
jgi:hypothetical protein